MRYTAQITVHGDADRVEALFASEDKEFANGRAKYEIRKSREAITFSLEAQDPTALRAVLNSVSKMLAVYDKAKSAIEELENG